MRNQNPKKTSENLMEIRIGYGYTRHSGRVPLSMCCQEPGCGSRQHLNVCDSKTTYGFQVLCNYHLEYLFSGMRE